MQNVEKIRRQSREGKKNAFKDKQKARTIARKRARTRKYAV